MTATPPPSSLGVILATPPASSPGVVLATPPASSPGIVLATPPRPITPLSIEQIVLGRFYNIKLISPPSSDDSSPITTDQTVGSSQEGSSTATNEELDHIRIALVVGRKAGTLTVLLCSLSVTPSHKGNEHRWVPVDGSTLLPKQPPIRVMTNPRRALSSCTAHPYLCFTHVVVVRPVQQQGARTPPPMNRAANAHFVLTDSILGQAASAADDDSTSSHAIKCTNVDEIRQAHVNYWNGVRYDLKGDRIDRRFGHGKSGSDGKGGSDGKSSSDGMSDSDDKSGSDGKSGSDSKSGSGETTSSTRRREHRAYVFLFFRLCVLANSSSAEDKRNAESGRLRSNTIVNWLIFSFQR